MTKTTGSLANQLLLAMPSIGDPRLGRSVIYMQEHNEEGAMGFIVNRPAEDIVLQDILESLDMPTNKKHDMPVFIGGPVDTGRGFVLHDNSYHSPSSIFSADGLIGMTATLDVLEAICNSNKLDNALVILGYAGWDAGQLEDEIQDNAWIACESDMDLIFNLDPSKKYAAAMMRLGIDLGKLSAGSGQA